MRTFSKHYDLPDHKLISHCWSKGLYWWKVKLLSEGRGSLSAESHTFPLSAVHEASSGSTAWVFLLSLTSVIPPLIQQSVVLKSRSLLELGEVFLSSPYKLLILSQYCKVTWDMTVLTIKEVIISFKC